VLFFGHRPRVGRLALAVLGALWALPPAAARAGEATDCAPVDTSPTPSHDAAAAPTEDVDAADDAGPDDDATTTDAPDPDGTAASPAATDPAIPQTAAEALGRTPRRVKCLDESLIDESGRARVRKGVQPRYFRKARRVAISLGGGAWAGDLLDTSWHAHGNVAFWPTEALGFDADFKLTPMTYRLERSATSFTGSDRYPDGMLANFAYVAMGHVLLAPLHTKQRMGRDKVRHGDFTVFAGAGRAFHDSTQGIGFDVGMSLYWYVAKFVSVRLDVSDVILSQDVFGSRRISNNLVLSSGVALWIPFRRRE
jgi:hypothetical protein